MSAHYGHFKLDMANAPTFSVAELKELALEASEKIPEAKDFEHLFSKVAPILFNKNIYASMLVGLGIVEYAKWVMNEIRETEQGDSTDVLQAEITFRKPLTSADFVQIMEEELRNMDISAEVIHQSAHELAMRVSHRLGVTWLPKEVSGDKAS